MNITKESTQVGQALFLNGTIEIRNPRDLSFLTKKSNAKKLEIPYYPVR